MKLSMLSPPPASTAATFSRRGASPWPAPAVSASGCCTSATTPSPSSAMPHLPTRSPRSRRTPRTTSPSRWRAPTPCPTTSPATGGRATRSTTPATPSTLCPSRTAPLEAPFVCNISVATMSATEPAHLVQYGHGLLGSNHEIDAGNVRSMANDHNVVFCATKWAGMSEDDIGNAINTLGSSPTSPPWRTACSRACSTRSCSAG